MDVVGVKSNYEVIKCSKKARLTIVPFMYKILTRHPDAVVNFIPEDIAAICEIVNNKTIMHNPITNGYMLDGIEYGNALDVFNSMKDIIILEFLEYFVPNGIPVFKGKKHGLHIDDDNLMSTAVYLKSCRLSDLKDSRPGRRQYMDATPPECYMYNDAADLWLSLHINKNIENVSIGSSYLYDASENCVKTTMAAFVMDFMRYMEVKSEVDRLNAMEELIQNLAEERQRNQFMSMSMYGIGPKPVSNSNINITVNVTGGS